MAEAVHQFQNIVLGGRGGTNPGHLKINPDGFFWRKTGGGKVVDVLKKDVSNLTWLRVPKGFQLAVLLKAGSKVKFNGFREQDVSSLSQFMTSTFGISAKQRELATSGRNWGEAEVDGNFLTFKIGQKQAFDLSIADVSQAQIQGKNDVFVEFHVDDTAGANEKDTLTEMTLFVPPKNILHSEGDDDVSSAQVLLDMLLARADLGPSGAESVLEFELVHILTPRGRFKVEMHASFLRLQGLANDFKIQYTSIARIFVLPKTNQPHTFVVVTLDPPIRKGQTFYNHLVVQFPNDSTLECSPALSEELLKTKYEGRLQASYKDLEYEVFAQVLRGLADAKVTRPGSFRSCTDGFAVRTSLKAEEGYLYPLERGFFFLPKPPTLIRHADIEHVEFERHGAGTSGLSSSYFDLVIRVKNVSTSEYQFRNIQRTEYHNLFNFISTKHLKIFNLGDTQAQVAEKAAAALDSDDDAVDPHLNRIKTAIESGGAGEESDEEDEDFVAGKDDGGSPTASSEGGEGGDEDSDASKDADGSDEERPAKKEKAKEEKPPKTKAALPVKRKKKEKAEEEAGEAGEEGDGGGKKRRKKEKKKKDPNAPKRALSGFMCFSTTEREAMKKENPGLSFTDIAKAMGERWKSFSAEEKAPYEEKAKKDKARYTEQMVQYRLKGAGVEDDVADEEDDED